MRGEFAGSEHAQLRQRLRFCSGDNESECRLGPPRQIVSNR